MAALNQAARDLILAAEIAGLLHDLGKLHPGFAGEMLAGGSNLSDAVKGTGIKFAHGAILENERVYPDAVEVSANPGLLDVLARLRTDAAWAKVLTLPDDWIGQGTVQAPGLGAPLRQHHATKVLDQHALLGDIYTFGADIRDSALDKGSGGANEGKQVAGLACIADSFGHTRNNYSAESLAGLWQQVPGILADILFSPTATSDLISTRNALLDALFPVFTHSLGETRRPTNDVTLWHHCYSSASFFKAAVAEGALRGNFTGWQDDTGMFDLVRIGRLRFRLLGIRWDWTAITEGALAPVALVSMSNLRRDVVESLRRLFEETETVGNLIYDDDDGVLALVPGFWEADAARAETLFLEHVIEPLAPQIADCISELGTGTPFRLCWTEPTLYLTDYAEALGLAGDTPRQRHLQAGEAELRALWRMANDSDKLIQVCPQCGMRPAETREFSHTESARREQRLCDECEALIDRDAKRARRRSMQSEFGFSSASNLEDLAREGSSSRVALISLRVDAGEIAAGHALITQLARPIAMLTEAPQAKVTTANALGDWFEENVLKELRSGKMPQKADLARKLLGDQYWLSEKDGRAEGEPVARALAVARDFFLRESAGLPEEWKLARHDGDRLALFAMRKHASPARLQRLWDDLRQLWRDTLGEVAAGLDYGVLPLSFDARGIRFAVAASDADAAVKQINARLSQQLGKVRGGFAVHVSCVVMRARFPLYLALETLGRLESRVGKVPRQTWKLVARHEPAPGRVRLEWMTPQGVLSWDVDTATSDPQQADRWHPHVLLAQHDGKEVTGPNRIVHVKDLKVGDHALIPPMTFDSLVLEGTSRRHQLAWRQSGEQLLRPHWVLGDAGRAPLLLELFDSFSGLVKSTGWDGSKVKGLQGEMVETYEKWVRDAPASLAATGRQAWEAHLRTMLLRYVGKGPESDFERARLLENIVDGRFFDAVEWTTFVAKKKSEQPVTIDEAIA
jgi:hypothetical protein